MVITCPKSAADAIPVNIVATVDEYFFNIVSESIKDMLKRILLLRSNTLEICEYI